MISTSKLLIDASDAGDLAAVRRLLLDHVSPNDHDQGGNSALILAADGGYLDIALELLKYGADVNYEDDVDKVHRS